MEQLQIKRTINNNIYNFILSCSELEQAYQLKRREYLNEDFSKKLAEDIKNSESRFHFGHLEAFPELNVWLCNHYDHFFDANMTHNDLIELTLNHLNHASLTPGFFHSLALLVPAVCEGTEKSVSECEKNCPHYYSCDNIASADNQSIQWELLASLLTMHQQGICSCSSTEECAAKKYLSGEWDLCTFFHSADDMESPKNAAIETSEMQISKDMTNDAKHSLLILKEKYSL